VIRTIELMPVRQPIVVGPTDFIRLADEVRRASVPKMYVQLYDQHPIMGGLIGARKWKSVTFLNISKTLIRF
jgi:hypothetical protein